MADEKFDSPGESDESSATPADDPRGENLAAPLDEPGDYVIADDEVEAEELDADGDGLLDDTDEADASDSDEPEIDDPEQLEDAEAEAVAAASTAPVRRRANAPVRRASAPEKKELPTRRRSRAVAKEPRSAKAGPVTFVNQSVGELRKVVWPTGSQLQQYFVVVLVFVLFIIAFVGLLDLLFGWLLLKALG